MDLEVSYHVVEGHGYNFVNSIGDESYLQLSSQQEKTSGTLVV